VGLGFVLAAAAVAVHSRAKATVRPTPSRYRNDQGYRDDHGNMESR
jgi:hypothetical protein